MKYNPKYEKYIKKEIYRLGKDSDEFRLSYRLEWILERSMFVTLKALTDKVYDKTLSIVERDLSAKHVVGIDFGKVKDSTIVTVGEPDWDNPVILEKPKNIGTASLMSNSTAYIAYKVKIKAWLELLGDDYESQYQQIMDFLDNYNVVKMCIDATGTGAPIADRLIADRFKSEQMQSRGRKGETEVQRVIFLSLSSSTWKKISSCLIMPSSLRARSSMAS
jgi:hypothetical protein